MDNNTGKRYRGAQPFSDDELSQRTFFGREEAAESLTNQVLANRLVVVYAKSGVGKSSLLNAGVAPRLREAGYQPLMIRLNDIQLGPTASVFEGVRSEASRQKTEYVHGDTTSLWTFFKTVEFWRGDRLLKPVLVIDQFEELFTLHSEAARDAFLSALSYVIRGVPPPSSDMAPQTLGDTAPAIHVVFSLREDFLGILEDGADRIPQIMDHRFRLMPLSRQSAADAMAGPAMLADPGLATQPFTFAPEFTDVVLDYLTTRTAGPSDIAKRFVEPFHLQLICQRVEQVIDAKAYKARPPHAFDLADFGGKPALSYTLATFYTNAIRSISEPPLRAVAKRLCEEFLISPEGRRLSIEEHELRKQLRLSERALAQLVDSRLLRTDRRSDSTYYELSHDALVEPVLATRRTQALLLGWSAILFGSIGICVSAFLVLGFVAILIWPQISVGTEVAGSMFVIVSGSGLFLLARQILRAGWRSHRRFRPRRVRVVEQAVPEFVRGRDKVLGWLALGTGLSIVVVLSLAGLATAVGVVQLFVQAGAMPSWIEVGEDAFWANVYLRPMPEIVWLVITLSINLLFGAMLCYLGWRRLNPTTAAGQTSSGPNPGSTHWLSPVTADRLRASASVVAFALGATGFYLLYRCANTSQGLLPDWLPHSLLSSDIPIACKKAFAGDWSVEEGWLVFFVFSALCLSLPGFLQLARSAWRRSAANAAG